MLVWVYRLLIGTLGLEGVVEAVAREALEGWDRVLEVEIVGREIVFRAGRSLAHSIQCIEGHRFLPNKGRSIIGSLIVDGHGHVGLSFGDRLRWHGVPAHRVDVEGGLHLHLRARLKPRTGAKSARCTVEQA